MKKLEQNKKSYERDCRSRQIGKNLMSMFLRAKEG